MVALIIKFDQFHQIPRRVVEHHPPAVGICFHTPGQVHAVKAEFFDGLVQVRDGKGDYGETRLGVWREGGAAADKRQVTAIQSKIQTITRMVRHNTQPDHVPVKKSGGRNIFRPQTDNSNANVHVLSF